MKYLKKYLADGAEVARLNKLIMDGPNEEPEGQILGTFQALFANDFSMKIVVVNHAAGPAITASLFDDQGHQVGHEELIPGGVDQDYPFDHQEDNYRLTIERVAASQLTREAAEEYVATGGVRCPHCCSDDVDQGPVQTDAGEARCRVQCMACEAQWTDCFTLTSVESVEGPAQNVGRPADPES